MCFQKLTLPKPRGESNWSMSELTQAVVLLAHFHVLSSFVCGCGINPEVDHESGHTFRRANLADSSTSTEDLRVITASGKRIGSSGSSPSVRPESSVFPPPLSPLPLSNLYNRKFLYYLCVNQPTNQPIFHDLNATQCLSQTT